MIEKSGVAYLADGNGYERQFGTKVYKNDADLETIAVAFLATESVRPPAPRAP